MSLRAALLWLVPLAVVAVWALSLSGPSAATTTVPPAAMAGTEDEPSSEPQAPSAAHSTAQPRAAAQSPPAAYAAGPPTPPAVLEPEQQREQQPEQQPAAAEAKRPDPSELFSAAFLEEERDTIWAPEAEANVRAAFEKAQVPSGALLSVKCRSSLCKIDMLFDRNQHQAFAIATHHLRESFARDISVDHQSAPTNLGPERMTVYVPRQGKTLKDFAQ